MFKKPKNKQPSAEQLMAEFLSKKKSNDSQNQQNDEKIKFQALWEILKEKLDLSDDDLEAKISTLKQKKESDIKTPENCKKCNRPVSIKTGICVYCGVQE